MLSIAAPRNALPQSLEAGSRKLHCPLYIMHSQLYNCIDKRFKPLAQPEVEESFLNHTRTDAVFRKGFVHPPPIQVLPTGAIVLNTSLGIPGVDRRKAFEQFLGVYECTVENVYGKSTNKTEFTECG